MPGFGDLFVLRCQLQCYLHCILSVVRVMGAIGAYAYIWSVSRVFFKQAFAQAGTERHRDPGAGRMLRPLGY